MSEIAKKENIKLADCDLNLIKKKILAEARGVIIKKLFSFLNILNVSFGESCYVNSREFYNIIVKKIISYEKINFWTKFKCFFKMNYINIIF